MRVSFGPFTIDSGRRRLSRKGGEIALSPKAFDLLRLLLERRPNVVGKGELIAEIWPDTHVLEANLNVLVGEIRRAISDTPQRARFIQTVHRIGFAFCGDALDLESHPSSPEHRAPSGCWLSWNERTFVLSDGDNVIGRDPGCDVWLDGAGVSRQHARVRVEPGARAVLEDLKSTNGTLLQGTRLIAAATLADGDVIGIGSVELTFRRWRDDKARPTERIRRS